ncbi:MAG: hypothetical protein D3903_08965 [Candidatus Electrothrix sp. GM3_4]|nr:hypothetical protein [Candidatus Electrothrix sp. GM3_4]
MEKILDCSSIDTALSSFEKVLQAPKEILLQRLEDCRDQVDDSSFEAEDELLEVFFPDRSALSPFDSIAWFHLTRVSDPECFLRKGILPTDQIVDQIWSTAQEILQGKGHSIDIEDLRKKLCEQKSVIHYVEKYFDKLNKNSTGPYAFLIRETYYNHYLKCPEIIVDICRVINELCSIDIENDFKKLTRPYIVKFKSEPGKNSWNEVGTALLYVYKYATGDVNVSSGHSFIGTGAVIEPRNILSIEPAVIPITECNDKELLPDEISFHIHDHQGKLIFGRGQY